MRFILRNSIVLFVFFITACSSPVVVEENDSPLGISSFEELFSSSSTFEGVSSSSLIESTSSSSIQDSPKGIPLIKINTLDGVQTDSIYVECSIEVQGNGTYPNYSSAGVKIKQRGNSSRIFYDKKPYKLKLPVKASLLGLEANKDWVLLANYRDPTHFMNALAFDMARYMELPFTNSTRFVEVELNGEYVGMYQFTEQIEEGKSRVNISKTDGVLLSLDLDDGPELSPNATDNFYSTVYELPVCVKFPDEPTEMQLSVIKEDFAVLERYIKNLDYESVKTNLDVQSYIKFLIIQELTRNVELVSPRSMYMYKDNGVYHFGPVWDFDGGFAFDWASMTVGHGYFGSESWLMGSTNPAIAAATKKANPWKGSDAYDVIPGFFVDLFANKGFTADYKATWNQLKPGLLNDVIPKLNQYTALTAEAMTRNATRWPIDKNNSTEIERLKTWFSHRVENYSAVVNNY